MDPELNPAFVAGATILLFFGSVAVFVWLRIRSGGRLEVKTSDAVLGCVPLALGLLLTGHLKEVGIGDVKLVAAVREASRLPVESQVLKLPVTVISSDEKGRMLDLERLLERGSQALAFRVGRGGYVGPAIRDYLVALSGKPSFRYLLFKDRNGHFIGIADGRVFASRVQNHAGLADQLAEGLNHGDEASLRDLPGFVSARDVLRTTDGTVTALERLAALEVDTLPVVDEKSEFVGVVERSNLSARMLIEIAQRLDGTR